MLGEYFFECVEEVVGCFGGRGGDKNTTGGVSVELLEKDFGADFSFAGAGGAMDAEEVLGGEGLLYGLLLGMVEVEGTVG
ncbi:MAG: hypothetical protein A2912_02395 [Candidatus Buchananbacteria bacterium RIFCSPLOWO2_01_FULL_40_23b]|uniref:Uncharacterized protein n=1 Tax=Candidatus Buchananbacteria bacterium RIFCSPLOWO2_01_FULL_40_23b TaxID=1797544 RepID=A0A1G1YN97_9BACT|nr:MAG: hypothetical protein A2912_02395 [Candidatus Buchananbacteria bacterium RIFCSPLOWO2_01_FULL_40_23b]